MAGKTVVIAGAGVFGTAIAERLSWNDENTVILYSIEQDVVEDINTNNRNSKYFPTRFINRRITATSSLDVFRKADYIFLVIPSKAIVSFTQQIKGMTKEECIVVNLAKGMSDDGAFITEKIPFRHTASLKGPTFAIEVLNGFPSAFTFGGTKEVFEKLKKEVFPKTGIYLDYTSDVRAVELMSILKNMYAIAIGLVSGRYNSPNVDFIVYTKAVNEMKKFLRLFGCDEDCIFRYCGIGDLGLTSLNDLSRNRTLGLLIGKGFLGQDSTSTTVVEGHRTIKLMAQITRDQNVIDEFPLVNALHRIMYEGKSINDYLAVVFS